MKYIYSKNIFFFIILIALVLITVRLVNLWSFPDTDWILKKGEKTALESNYPLLQKFTAAKNNLSKIEILFSSSDIKPGGAILMEVLDENCSRILRKREMRATNLEAENTYAFRFSRIPDSQGKTYCLALSYSPFIENGKKAKVFLANTSPTGSIALIIPDGEEIENKSLAMRPGYQKNTVWENIQAINQRISQYKPWFLKHYFLYAIVSLFVLLSLLLITVLIYNIV